MLKTMDAPVEPPACDGAFSTEAGGLHYSWRGEGRQKASTIGVYNVQTEQWTLTPTTGPPPSGYCNGGCVIILNDLFAFGGWNGPTPYNDLHKLNLTTFQWNKIYPKNDPSEMPICKGACGLIAVNERTLVCFGGYGSKPGSSFIRRIGSNDYTNEIHLFDIQEGVWSSPQVKGERPPCSRFTFTKLDHNRAVFFGGLQSGKVKVNDLYLFNLRKMEVTKVEPAQGDQWPEARFRHGACCLNYGEDHLKVLMSGGLGNGDKVLGDMWILDVDNGKWTAVSPPESVRGRWHHSITATSLSSGLTEVLVFGGKLKFRGAPTAETTILRFERSLSVTEPPTEKWGLVDVAHNNTRGSSQRLREKREKIRQATHRPSSANGAQSLVKSTPVLPRNWIVVFNGEMNKPVYQHRHNPEMTSSTPPGYPLCQTLAYPGVTFYGEPQEREFSFTGGHADFNNGVEATVPPHAISPGYTVGVRVQPGFAPSDVFVMPEGIQSASPSYLISSDGSADLNGEATVTMEHHVRVSTREEADDLLFLQADPTPSEGCYKYQQVSEGRSEFTPGENKGRLTTRHLSQRFLKVGLCQRCGESFASTDPQQSKTPTTDRNLYTVRIYRSPQQTTGDRLAIICVSLYGTLYAKFLDTLDNVVIPRDYPEVSTRVADRTIVGSVHFIELFAKLCVHPTRRWIVEPDRDEIFKREVDLPEVEKFKPEDLHDYPPRIISQFYPEGNASERTTCRMSLTGLTPEVKIQIPLRVTKVQTTVDTGDLQLVDTTKLLVAADMLKETVRFQVNHSDEWLSSTAKYIFPPMDMMCSSLRWSTVCKLAAHTNSIKTHIETVLKITRRLTEECTRHSSMSESIGAHLSKMEKLSNKMTKVKLEHCQDQSEETAALNDMVENGADLLRTVDCLLKDISVDATDHKTLTVEDLKRRTGVSDMQLDSRIKEKDLPDLAGCFDQVDIYLYKLNLTPGQQTDVKDLAHQSSTTVAMAAALKFWRQPNPFDATFRALLELLLDLRRGDVAVSVCQHITSKVPNC